MNEKSTISYRLAAILFAVISVFNIIALNGIYLTARRVADSNMASSRRMTTINELLSQIGKNAVLVITGINDKENMNIDKKIEGMFSRIEGEMREYESIETTSEFEKRRYNHTKLSIAAYQKKLNDVLKATANADSDTATSIYVQELLPIETATKEMLMSTIELSTSNASARTYKNSLLHGSAQLTLMIFFFAGEAAIGIASRRAKKAAEAIEMKNAQLAAQGQQITRSQQKAHDIALSNVLTGLPNRYALEAALQPRLEKDQFNIGVYDMDGFKMINDTYGYSFGDEYIAMIGDRLSTEFKDVATIYSVTGNEFCFIFNQDVPDSQAQRISERVIAIMGDVYSISGIAIQLSASGSIYHYLPNDCINTSALLVKMDNVLREAKRSGGNVVYTVTGL